MFVHLFTGVFGQSMWALKLTQLVPFLSSFAGMHPAVNSFLNWNLGTLIVTFYAGLMILISIFVAIKTWLESNSKLECVC